MPASREASKTWDGRNRLVANHHEIPTTTVDSDVPIADALEILLGGILFLAIKHDVVLLNDDDRIPALDRASPSKQHFFFETLDVDLDVIKILKVKRVERENRDNPGLYPSPFMMSSVIHAYLSAL